MCSSITPGQKDTSSSSKLPRICTHITTTKKCSKCEEFLCDFCKDCSCKRGLFSVSFCFYLTFFARCLEATSRRLHYDAHRGRDWFDLNYPGFYNLDFDTIISDFIIQIYCSGRRRGVCTHLADTRGPLPRRRTFVLHSIATGTNAFSQFWQLKSPQSPLNAHQVELTSRMSRSRWARSRKSRASFRAPNQLRQARHQARHQARRQARRQALHQAHRQAAGARTKMPK